jgi:hypothetical protein
MGVYSWNLWQFMATLGQGRARQSLRAVLARPAFAEVSVYLFARVQLFW